MRIILAFAFEAVDSGGLFFTNECRTGCQPVPAPKQLTPKTGWQPVLRFPGIESFRLEARKPARAFTERISGRGRILTRTRKDQ